MGKSSSAGEHIDRHASDVGRHRAAAAGYAVRLVRVQGEQGHVIGIAIGHGSGEGEGAIDRDGEVVAVVILQYHGAGEPGDRAAHGVRIVGAGHGYMGGPPALHGVEGSAAAVAYDAGLPNGLGENSDVVGAAVADERGKGKAAIGRDGEVIAAVVLQHYGAGKPGDRAAYG